MKCAASRLQGAFPVVQAYLKETVSCCEKLNLKLEGFFVFVFSFLGGGGVYFPFVQRSCVIAVLVR